ncbi:unnamed protein product [Cylicostephanus goldi]|uniref:Uncharacterized protein n=1 Tax=Cylicostephanus goldi TaxID=71465 RepID=A0A3P6QB58_CYLGO|nr:unnamed protein product [Cylicostephanus goldi]
MYSVKDTASVDMGEAAVPGEKVLKEKASFTTQEDQILESEFEIVDIPYDDEKEKEKEAAPQVDEAAREAALAVASAIMENLLQESYVEYGEVQRRTSDAQKKESGATTPLSEQFEEIAEINIELPSDEESPSPMEKQKHEETLIELSCEEHDYVKLLVQESIDAAMKDLTALSQEPQSPLEPATSGQPTEAPEIQIEEATKAEPTPALELLKAHAEEVLVPLELHRDQTSYSTEISIPRARKCKLTVFLTFDEGYDSLPIQEVQLQIEFQKPPQSETTEQILSQIMYEDDGESDTWLFIKVQSCP